MAESLHNSSDVPNFDTYPATPPERQIGHTNTEPLTVERVSSGPSSLEQHAAELGAAAGKVVVMVRRTKETMENLSQHAMYDRISDLAESAVARADQLRQLAENRTKELAQAAQAKAAELGRQAREKGEDLTRRAKEGYSRTRVRARQTAHDYPIHVAIAAGIVGFILGVGLRIRKAKHEY
jgi:ABC-type transporter Mla subunit MlaD